MIECQGGSPDNCSQTSTDLIITLAELQNDIADAEAKKSEPLDIILHGDDKVEHEGNWRTYRDRQSRLDKQRGQAFSMILGQCTQQLIDRMKQDNVWQQHHLPMTHYPLLT